MLGGDISFSPEAGVGILMTLATMVFIGFLSVFFTSYMLLTIAKVRLSNAVRYSLIAGVLSSLFVGALLIGPVKVILGYVAAYGRNPSMVLISLLIILLIIVPPLLSIFRMLISRDPYKKVEKKIAITGIVCVLFIILIWIIYLSWSRASGYNFSF